MGRDKHFTAQLCRVMGVLGLAVVLAACAVRPKPLDPTRPYTVTEVQVTAENIRDLDFAQRLQLQLEATAGRATSDIGQTSKLQVVVIDYGAETGLINFFDSSIRAVSTWCLSMRTPDMCCAHAPCEPRLPLGTGSVPKLCLSAGWWTMSGRCLG